ncbi:replication protein A 70 kDa DNA-binding subunit B [Trifolium repens]|nr:replication protein A 70 kDa DNA-binding subunit B [Trifolium repens]
MSPSQAYCFLNNLANATNESSIKVRFARMWDNMNVRKQNDMISIDMVLIDEESNYIHASLPKKFAPKFRKKNLQEGKIYVVNQFEVLPNKKSYAVVKNNSSMLQFNDDTTYSEVEDDDSILLHVFEFVKYAHLESRIDKHVLTDIIGVIVDVNPIEERKVPGGKVDMLSIRLKDISGNIINVTLWGRHATIFEDTLKGNLCDAPDPNVAVITSTTSKRYQGDLSLNSSSSTKIYVNIDIPEAAELIQSFKSTNVLHPSANASLTNSAILDKTRTISEILSSAVSGSNTAAVFNCVATVDEIFDKNGWYYVSCPKCKKSASAAETHFKCEFCHESVDYPITRYRLELGVKDSTGSTIFVLFDDVAEQVAQMKLVDLTATLENETEDGSSIPHQLKKIIGTIHIFQIKMKSYFEGRGRQSFTVSRIVKPKVKVEKDDKLDSECNTSSSCPKIMTPRLPQKRRRLRLQYEEDSNDVEQKEVASDLEE